MNNFIILICILLLNFQAFANEHGGAEKLDEPDEIEKEVIIVDKARVKLLLNQITQMDYGVIGGIDGINKLMSKVNELSPNLLVGNTLDIGSGAGSVAHFFHKNGFANVTGIDINNELIEQAKKNYPDIKFQTANALALPDIFKEDTFDFVYMFNSAYLIKDKVELFQKVKDISKTGSLMAIYDFAVEGASSFKFLDIEGNQLYPINITETKLIFNVIGYKIVYIADITSDYIAWYANTLDLINAKKEILVATNFTNDEITVLEKSINKIMNYLKDHKLKAVLIFAEKI